MKKYIIWALIISAIMIAVACSLFLRPKPSAFSAADWADIIYTPTKLSKTGDWKSFSVEQNDSNAQITFKMPKDWKLDGTVFYDGEGNKIAEFMPGIILLSEGSNYEPWLSSGNEEGYVKVLSVEKFSVKDNKGNKKIEEVYTEAGVWYPNIYLIEGKNKVLIISFYERELNSSKRAIFDGVVSTIKF